MKLKSARLYYVFTDYFNGTLLTYLPLYLFNKYNYSGSKYGTILLIAGLFALVGIIISPYIINIFKREKSVMIVEFTLMFLAIIVLANTNNYYVIIVAMSFIYLNRMAMYSIGDNLIEGIAKSNGLAYGKFRSFGSVGWGTCFLVNGYLVSNQPQYFLIFFAIICIGAIINLFFLSEDKKETKVSSILHPQTYRNLKIGHNAFVYLIVVSLVSICIQTSANFTNILIQDLDGRVDLYGTLTAVLVTVEFTVMFFSHNIRRKLLDQRYFELVGILLIFKMICLVFASTPTMVYLTALIDPFIFGLVLPFTPSFLKDNVAKKDSLTVFVIMGILTLVVTAVYSKISGEIMQYFNIKAVFIGYLIIACLIYIITKVFKINYPRNELK